MPAKPVNPTRLVGTKERKPQMKMFLILIAVIGSLVISVPPTTASVQQTCVIPSVTASPDPVAVGSAVNIQQTLTNSCNGNGNITFWTNVESDCAGNVTLEYQRNIAVPGHNGALTFNDSFTPICAGTYTVTTTVQSGPQKFTSATTTFTAQ